jgi:small subunit ribosomal protein S1
VVLVTGEPLQLSRGLRAPRGPSLAGLKQARESGLPVQGRVTAVNKGGLEVELGGVRGFCPLSQMDDGYVEDASAFVGRTLEFVVTEVDEARARVVVSRRRLLQERKDSQRRERMAALAVGQELEGRVTRIEPFGAFVDLGGVDGLVHVSEIAATRVRHPRDVLAPGETVRVRVLRIEPEKRRIALSIRRVYEEE